MEITLQRLFKKPDYTIGHILVNGDYYCDSLEDTDRHLSSDMTAEEIKQIKVHGSTAIPTGRYRVVETYSPKFKRNMPLLLNVPGFSAIRIHPGNTIADTDGCILPGWNKQKGMVLDSRKAFLPLERQIYEAIFNGEKIFINIK